MANLNYRFSLMKFLLSSSLLFMLVACFLNQSNGLEDRKDTATESHYHTVEISSLFPASVCSPSTSRGSNGRQSALEVTHRHGPCSQPGQENAAATPSLSEILSHDQSRVGSIQAQINPNSDSNIIKDTTNSHTDKLKDKKASLPVQSGRSLGSGNYIVTLGLGTPKRTLSLVFDTASDLTWTQCQPCVRCYKQQDPIFNPSASSSFSNVSCSSAQCSELSAATGSRPGCSAKTCVYGIEYGDQSFSVGFLSQDKLTLTETAVFPNFVFGCGKKNEGLFGNTAGILGLGRNHLSAVSQTAEKYGKYFSYCLPSTSSSKGHLTLGKCGAPSKGVKFTSLSSSQSLPFFFIDILSISVGGHQLPITQTVFKTAGSIIDSGTVITRLPPAAYSSMRAVFRKLMAKYPTAPAISILDTCYDFSRFTTVTIPTISFTFSGDVKVDLAPSGILVTVSLSRVCLAFAGNHDARSVGIFGNTQQKTLEVVYDVAGGNLGFGPGGCQ